MPSDSGTFVNKYGKPIPIPSEFYRKFLRAKANRMTSQK